MQWHALHHEVSCRRGQSTCWQVADADAGRVVTYLRLFRSVARTLSMCNWCGYEIAPYSAAYSITVGGVAMSTHCSQRCASRVTRARLELHYV